ncbi:hypothetical protein F511_37232 [Dorcoceras hygrometricum]|uniref:Uncharacterized protein n=1 Tax=Dorcoceras hygrometricum TaxID=472368 RepID=A0A2Z7C1Q4_9LAMI|nr:hypothetical protein F511_37232 [Dorcoceras hygrometricum]
MVNSSRHISSPNPNCSPNLISSDCRQFTSSNERDVVEVFKLLAISSQTVLQFQ